ncbi:MAG: DMT family transporter [Bosea sp. (in: a-proteobacteria)]
MMTLFRRLWANPYLLLTITCLLWGGNAIASRLAVNHIPPITLTSLRWVCVCAVMPLLLRKELREHWPALKANAGLILAMGIFGYTAFNALMYLAAYSTTAINMGILQGSIPVFVLLGAWLVFGTRIAAMQMLGVVVTLVGVAMVASRGDWAVLRSLTFATGDIAMMAACLFYASYTVALRKRPPMPGLVFFTAMACVACVVSLPLMATEWAIGQGYVPTLQGWLILAYVAIGPSLLSQLFFMRGVELIGPGRAGVFVNLVPVFSAVLGVLLLSEPFAWYHGVALALVLGGIFIAERLGGKGG